MALPYTLPYFFSAPAAGTGSGAYTWAGSAAGSHVSRGTATGTYTWSSTAAGAKTSRGTASGTYTWSSTAAGAKTSRGTASGTYTWAGTAAGKRTPKATASGTYTWAGTAAGTRASRGTNASTYTWASVAVGRHASNGTASGTYTWVSAQVGKRTPKATATGAYAWSSSATGIAPIVGAKQGAASGIYLWAGNAAGAHTSKGTTSGAYTWAGSAAGIALVVGVKQGSGSGTYTWSSTAVGPRLPISHFTFTEGSGTFATSEVGGYILSNSSGVTWASGGGISSKMWGHLGTGAPSEWSLVFDMVLTSVDTGGGWQQFMLHPSSGSTYWIQHNSGHPEIWRGDALVASGTILPTWAPCQLIYTVTATSQRIYLDGNLVASRDTSSIAFDASEETLVWDDAISGTLKEFRFYDVALTGGEVVALASGIPNTGSASGTYTWASNAAGIRPAVAAKQGTASGTYTWASNAAGKRSPKAISTSTYGWDGAVIGWRVSRGTGGTSTYTFTGIAVGDTPPNRGTTFGAYTWVSATAGTRTPKGTGSGTYGWEGFPGFGVTHRYGSAEGSYNWVGFAAFIRTAPLHPARVLAFAIEIREMIMSGENRTITMPGEDRTITVGEEVRTIIVGPENRSITVGEENRTIAISEENRLITL